MLKHCPKCDVERECNLESRIESYPIRSEEIEIEANVLICSVCGEDIFDKKLDSANMQKVYATYRAKHGLLSPDEIREIRERYGLSQRGMSRFLGWGEITLHRYESGGLPDRVHNDLLKMISTHEGMARYLQERGTSVPNEEAETVKSVLKSARKPISLRNTFEALQSAFGINVKTGYRVIDMERLKNMILFFTESGVWKTKLMKLLWYADFVAYSRNTCSISGLAYQRQTYGPVPMHFFTMLDAFENEEDIRMVEAGINDGILIYAERKADLSVFSASERDVLQYIWTYFSSYTSADISNKSHEERAWIETPQGHIITYDYAKDLSVH
ncbi:MAG: DUF4065 domain-containing protein [Firmicutes bacterium]|nr:DUF4065 domain-containing protein [Bacillota bacterium]